MIDWNLCSEDDVWRIHEIAENAAELCGGRYGTMDLSMSLQACHTHGCPLDLDKLDGFDDANLLHDVIGIHETIDRETGELTNCFLPRCSKPAAVAEGGAS